MKGYFPADYWYDFNTGKLISNNVENGVWIELDAPLTYIPLHLRGGYIMPTQKPANTTKYSRMNPFGLIIAPNHYGQARGDLFSDDGASDLSTNKYYYATFELKDSVLRYNIEHNTHADTASKNLDKIRIFAKATRGSVNFILNGNTLIPESKITFEQDQIILNDLNIPMSSSFVLEWTAEIYNPATLKAPVIDCSIQNDSITQDACERKGCVFNSANKGVPKCYIGESMGGYTVDSASNEEYSLKKLNNFKLFDEEVDPLTVKVTHGIIRNSNGLKKMTRIKVP